MIYMLEDDGNIRDFVTYALNNSGFEARGFETPSQFWLQMREERPELLILDIMLPEEDGISILKKLRENPETEDLPVILLTAKGTEFDKVLGLDSGADDYVSKPFGTMELISRVKALIRRSKKRSDSSQSIEITPADTRGKAAEYSKGDLYINTAGHFLEVGGKNVNLTLKEFELLVLLFENRGKVLTRDEILNSIWGYDFDGENRTVDVHIRTLRQKLGDAGEIVETVRGLGYKIG